MIAAVVPAAGESKRMGAPKLLLPWGTTTVLGQVISVLRSAGIAEIVVVTGAERQGVEEVCRAESVTVAFNSQFSRGEMLSSIQGGLAALGPTIQAALITLGDQPQLEQNTLRAVLAAYRKSGAELVVPSYQKRRGHPWLVRRTLWEELLHMTAPDSSREFLQRHAADIRYVEVDTPTILSDLDTREEYRSSRPGS